MSPSKSSVPRTAAASFCGLLLIGCAASPPEESRRTNRPNVLLIVVDTLRADHLGCYGDHRPISPAIDTLAADGVLYEQSYSYSDFTPYSHAALFTSRYVKSGDLTDHPTQVLAEVFADNGYRTYGISANPNLRLESGFTRGFASFNSAPISEELAADPAVSSDWNRRIEARSAPQTNNAVLGVLEAHRENAIDVPWFLFVNYLDPHDPYTERRPWSEEFRESASTIDGYLRRGGGLTLWEWNARVAPTLGEDDRVRLAELYAAEIRYTDDHLGRLFEYLGAAGWRENTIIALTSDHGELLGEHDLFTHAQACYEAELAVPLVFWSPWFERRGTRVADLAEGVDVAPTLLALSQIAIPREFAGRSLLTTRGEPIPTQRSFTRHYHAATVADLRRELGFPAEHTLDSDVFRFRDRKLYVFKEHDPMLFDISRPSHVTEAEDRRELVELTAWARDLLAGEDTMAAPERLDPAVEDALRSLGYLQ